MQTAVALADRGGIESLSMRSLGEALGVEAMSLYNHVANKDALLDAMVDNVFSEIGVPSSGAAWRSVMRERAMAVRAALSRHPWAIGLMESRRRPGPETLRHHDAVIGCLRLAGFSIAATAHAYSVLDSYIYGFVLNEQSLAFDTADVAEAGASMVREFPADEYPHLREFITEHAMRPGYDYGDEFDFGLDLILAALQPTAEAGARTPAQLRRRKNP